MLKAHEALKIRLCSQDKDHIVNKTDTLDKEIVARRTLVFLNILPENRM
jgi:hypothetical protein